MHGGSGSNAENHGATKSWKTWRKLHHAFNVDTGDIVGFKLTTKHVGDETARPVLIGEIDAGVDRLLADGAYDGGWGAACLAGMLGHESRSLFLCQRTRSVALTLNETGM